MTVGGEEMGHCRQKKVDIDVFLSGSISQWPRPLSMIEEALRQKI